MQHAGAVLLPRNLQAAPEPLRKALAPYRAGLVVAVAWRFPWDWLANLCAPEGMALVLGPALSLTARHGGKAKHDQSDAPKSAVVRRGGMRPQASVYPAQRRAPRDL